MSIGRCFVLARYLFALGNVKDGTLNHVLRS